MKLFELLPRPLGKIFRKLTHFTCNSRPPPGRVALLRDRMGGSQLVATESAVAVNCDPPAWRAAILAARVLAVCCTPNRDVLNYEPSAGKHRLPRQHDSSRRD